MKVRKFIGLPRKGTNAGLALEEELNEEADDLIEIVNGIGKTYAKTGKKEEEMERKVDGYDFIELKDTGRANERPIFTRLERDDRIWEGYKRRVDPLQKDFDRVYAGYDELLERKLGAGKDLNISEGFRENVKKIAEEEGYKLQMELGTKDNEVSWALMMASDTSKLYETVLIPKDFQNLVTELLEASLLDPNGLGVGTFEDYRNQNDLDTSEEEEIIVGEEGVVGIYMYVSGNTAEEYNLETLDFAKAKSVLGVFEKENDK